ncbi:aldose 1-epimerase [Candidatus Latescibacterota bacterium]
MLRFLSVFVVLMIVQGCGAEEDRADVTFSGTVTQDQSTGWNIVQLNAEDPENPGKNISIKVVPEGGSNLFSINVGGHDLVRPTGDLNRFKKGMGGIPVMFPTPNRVRNQTYVFMGETHTMTFPGDDKPKRLHGLVWDDSAWKFSEPVTTPDGISFSTWYVFDESNPRFPGYPFRNTLTVTYTLTADRVRIGYEVENQDSKPLGFGFGLHPFWNLIGSKEGMHIQADIPNRMLGENKLPSGELAPVADTEYSLIEPTLLSELKLDDVYFGATPESNVRITYDTIGLEIVQRASADFTHVVVYTPNDAVCVENQTCSTDMHNLYDKGFEKESNLQILDPGKTAGGHIDYLFELKE